MADEIPALSAAAPATSDADAAPSAPVIETAAIESKIELAEIEAPKAAPTPIQMTCEIEPPELATAPVQMAPDAPAAEIKATATELGASPRAEIAAAAAPITSIASTPARGNRYALLAATVVIAAGFGVVAGGLGAYGLTRPDATATTVPGNEKLIGLQNTVARMQTELAAVRTSVEASTRATNGQFAKITERFDRVEKAQTERAAKFTKAVETLERLEKRADVTPAREITGSVPAPQPVAAAPAHQPQQSQPPQQPILEGWVVRNVYRGTAIVQSRRMGTIDVEPGDVLPGVGRIESIKKQDGRWVVVTSRGLITSMR